MTQDTDHISTDEFSEEEIMEGLRARAKALGIKFSKNIGKDALQQRIDDHLADEQETAPAKTPAPAKATKAPEDYSVEELRELPKAVRDNVIRQRMRKTELRLVRVRIANMNPNKADMSGEIFSVTNKYLGTVRKYVPFGEATDNGYHVPAILLKDLKARKFLQVSTRRTDKGQIEVKTRWVPEFSIEELPPLTQEELAKLAATQAAAAGLE